MKSKKQVKTSTEKQNKPEEREGRTTKYRVGWRLVVFCHAPALFLFDTLGNLGCEV